MKIVNRKTFLSMPEGTVFSKYEPCIFGNLMIKGETTKSGNDFWAQGITGAIKSDSSEERFDILLAKGKTGESIEMDFECEGRDGLYGEEELFAVWEIRDVKALVKRLEEALVDGYGHEI